MSDIKQLILDAVESLDRWDEAISGKGIQALSYGEFISRNEVVELIEAHLESMVIVPEVPTDEMINSSAYVNDCFSESPAQLNEDIYTVMVKSFKAQP